MAKRRLGSRKVLTYEEQLAELGLVAADPIKLGFDLEQSVECDEAGYVRSFGGLRPAYDSVVSRVVQDNADPWDGPGGSYKIGIAAEDRKTIYREVGVGGFVELAMHVEPLVDAGFENILATVQHRRWDAMLLPTQELLERTNVGSPDLNVRDRAQAPITLGRERRPTPFVHQDLEAASSELQTLANTEREQVTLARIGQGRFRAGLIKEFGCRCGITGFNFEPTLRASHIKPWRDSTNLERLDPDNGLLLRADLDALFDAGYISVQASGELMRAEALPASVLCLLTGEAVERPGLPEALLTPGRRAFLEYHRAHVYLG